MSTTTIFNESLLKLASKFVKPIEKTGFVPPAGMDPAAMGGGGMPPGGAPPMDPMGGMGGMPPMDPMAAGAGGAPAPPPPPPGAEGAAAGGLPPELSAVIQAEVQKAMAGGAGGAGAAGSGAAGLKPKIDVNVELMQIKNMMAKLMDALNVQVPAQDMVATPEKLDAMAQGGETAVAGGAEGGGAIPPMEGMSGMEAAGIPGGETKAGSLNGDGLGSMGGDAGALLGLLTRIQG